MPQSVAAQGRERAAAAQAFDRGTQEALTENWEAAAQWFETADRLSPAAPALMNAIEARRRAGDEMRAASLALRARETYPDDQNVQAMASEVLDGAAAQYVRVDVECDAQCTVEVDGSLTGGLSFFVEPDGEHTVAAEFEHGRLEQSVDGSAGERVSLSFEAPPAPPPEEVTPVAGGNNGQQIDLSEPFRFPKAAFLIATALTVGAGAVTVWSGIDTLNRVDDYEDAAEMCTFSRPCPEGERLLADGQDRERRTNILIGATAGLAATTLVIAILTDWGSSDDGELEADESDQGVEASVGITRQGGSLVLQGSF